MNKNVLRSLSYGMYAVTTLDEGRHVGCIANSTMQVTYDTVVVSMTHENYTNQCMAKNKKFAISILGEDVEQNTIAFLGFQSGRDKDKFEMIDCLEIDGLKVIKNSVGYLICEVIDTMETETHTLFLGRILDGDYLNEAKAPMTYAYYHKERKGNSPQKAPTYLG